MELNLNGADALKLGDKGYNGDTEGTYVVAHLEEDWIGLEHPTTGRTTINRTESLEQDWRWFRDPAVTPTTVAQAISLAIDEAQEGLVGEDGGLFIGDGADRITEVSAELENAPNGLQSQFTVTTSDGKQWTVRVTPKA